MLESRSVTVGTAVTRVAEAAGGPLMMNLHNESGQAVYIGGTAVTTSTGFHLDQHEHLQITIYPGNELYACTASNTASLICLEQQL